jgi:hypothetical protein
VTVMVGPTVVSRAAQLLDPTAPWVLLNGHCPVAKHEWQPIALALTQDELLTPRMVTARAPSFDALFSTPEFLALGERLDGDGVLGGGMSLGSSGSSRDTTCSSWMHVPALALTDYEPSTSWSGSSSRMRTRSPKSQPRQKSRWTPHSRAADCSGVPRRSVAGVIDQFR